MSSVTHRYGWVGAVDRFLTSWRPGSYYPSTKLANVGADGVGGRRGTQEMWAGK